MKIIYLPILLACVPVFSQQGVGIGTPNPQQALHLVSPTGTIRLDGLNAANNPYNGGDIDGDLDLTNNTFPLYVDDQGDFTLKLDVLNLSEEIDELDDSMLPNSSISLPTNDADGIVTTEITSYPITVNRASILEVKYNLSFDLYLDSSKTIISDNLARRVYTYLTVNGQTREYGPATKTYSSGSANSTPGMMYTNCTAYITLPAAGTYNLKLMGAISSDIIGSGVGTTSKSTYVEFAVGNDSLLLRLY
jgi:hypothetical protein